MSAAARILHPRISRRLEIVCLCSLLLLAIPLHAQHDERAVRAAFVFHLTKYVEWPNPGNELMIGFVGEDRMGVTLQKVVDGKDSDGRTLRVVLSPTDEQLQQCSLVYFANAAQSKIRPALSKLKGRNILTVGENEEFARDGGMIGLVRDADEIQIRINLQAAQAAGLKISSRLLNLAVIVRSSGGE